MNNDDSETTNNKFPRIEIFDQYLPFMEQGQRARFIVDKAQKMGNAFDSSRSDDSYYLPIFGQIIENYYLYYNIDPFGRAGEHSEFMTSAINNFRSVTNNSINMLFSKKRALKSSGSPNDITFEQTRVCDAVLENFCKSRDLDGFVQNLWLSAWLMTTSFAYVDWDPFAGEMRGTGEYEGDVDMHALTFFDFWTDACTRDWKKLQYGIGTIYKNKYLLASQYGKKYPELAEKIIKQKSVNNSLFWIDGSLKYETDLVPVRCYYHRAMPNSLPHGWHTIVVGDGIVIQDEINPHSIDSEGNTDPNDFPFMVLKPSDWIGTIYGQTVASDLAQIQLLDNLVLSTIATNIAHFGLPDVYGPNIINEKNIGKLKYFTIDSGSQPPVAVNQLNNALSPHLFSMRPILEKSMETLSSQNAAVRGQPDANMKTATAVAMMQSFAAVSQSGADKNINAMFSWIGSFALKLLKKYVQADREVSIFNDKGAKKSIIWNRDKIKDSGNVYVDAIDFSSQSQAMKMEMTNVIKDLIDDPNERLYLFNNGKLSDLYRTKANELEFVEDENEKLQLGIIPPVEKTDMHPLHISKHKRLKDNVELRLAAQQYPESQAAIILMAIKTHIEKHELEIQMIMQPNPPPNKEEVISDGPVMSDSLSPMPSSPNVGPMMGPGLQPIG